jgi:hypothetical protein
LHIAGHLELPSPELPRHQLLELKSFHELASMIRAESRDPNMAVRRTDDQTLGDQAFVGRFDRRWWNPVLTGEPSVTGQRGSLGELAANDPIADLAGDLPAERLRTARDKMEEHRRCITVHIRYIR